MQNDPNELLSIDQLEEAVTDCLADVSGALASLDHKLAAFAFYVDETLARAHARRVRAFVRSALNQFGQH